MCIHSTGNYINYVFGLIYYYRSTLPQTNLIQVGLGHLCPQTDTYQFLDCCGETVQQLIKLKRNACSWMVPSHLSFFNFLTFKPLGRFNFYLTVFVRVIYSSRSSFIASAFFLSTFFFLWYFLDTLDAADGLFGHSR